MSDETTRPTSISDHPTTLYAQQVVDGEIVAGPHVRASCQRHLDDLKRDDIYFDTEKANHAIGFFEDVLKLNGGDFEGEPFNLLPWQVFCIGCLFGWMHQDGCRRFRMAFEEIGKGNGKSPMAAGVGIYMMTADNESRAEIYAAASKHDQAKILFRDAVAMVEQSPQLSERLHLSGGVDKHNIAYIEKGSFFRPISSEREGKGQSGPRPHCALLDEIHEHPSAAMVEFMRAGTKGRKQALIFMITNSGFDMETVCYDYHDYAIKVAHGDIEDDSFFSFVCSLDESDDPFEDESCWVKANPSLGTTIDYKYLREQVQQARGMPSKRNLVLRLNFCVWTESADGWISKDIWLPCEQESIDIEPEMECFAGLDMSYTSDLSALATVFKRGDNTIDAFLDFWKPKDIIKQAIENDRVPYDRWAEDGYLHLTEGKVIKLEPLAERMQEISDIYNLKIIGYDAYRHRELDQELSDLGLELPLQEHPQGFRRVKDMPLWMPKSFQELENAIIEKRLRVKYNPVLRWNVASAVVRNDPAGTDNRIFDKRKSRARIDGVVALAMAIGVAETMKEQPRRSSIYNEAVV